ncbi:unnamed protein product, partial [Didymodactylos carnosus]
MEIPQNDNYNDESLEVTPYNSITVSQRTTASKAKIIFKSKNKVKQTSPPPSPILSSTTSKLSLSEVTTNAVHVSDPNDQSIIYTINKQKYLYAKERCDNDPSEESTKHLVHELVLQIFTAEELEYCSVDGKIQRTRSFDTSKFRTINHHLFTLYGVRYSTYRQSKRFAIDLRQKQRSFKHTQKRKTVKQ